MLKSEGSTPTTRDLSRLPPHTTPQHHAIEPQPPFNTLAILLFFALQDSHVPHCRAVTTEDGLGTSGRDGEGVVLASRRRSRPFGR